MFIQVPETMRHQNLRLADAKIASAREIRGRRAHNTLAWEKYKSSSALDRTVGGGMGDKLKESPSSTCHSWEKK